MNSDMQRKVFIAFLKHEQIYDKYIHAMKNSNHNMNDIWGLSLPYAFSGYFSWSTTKEGHVFWNKISDKWQKICTKLKLSNNCLLPF